MTIKDTEVALGIFEEAGIKHKILSGT